MALEKFLYVDANGFWSEDDAAIQTSAGAGDADKLVKTSANGKLHSSLIDFQTVKRYFTVDVATTANITLSGEQTIDGVLTSASRVLVKNQSADDENGIYVSAAGAWTRATDYDEAEEIEDGSAVAVGMGTVNADSVFLQIEQVVTVDTDPINFINIGTNAIIAGDGLDKTGNTLSLDLASGGGLKIVSTELAVEPNDFAGDGLVDDGSDNLAINWATVFTIDGAQDRAFKASDIASTANGEGASIVGIEDAAGYYSSNNVEGALAEIFSNIKGISYTVGAGGVDKGDAVYISANNTILPHSTLSSAQEVIGLAFTTEAAAASVIVVRNDIILTGVLSGATAGTKYYWDGSAIVSTIPSGGGSHVWQVGIAKNATDLHTQIVFIKKNA
jgi:hypothetical protein